MTPSRRNPEERPVGALLAPDIIALLEESPSQIAAETEELHPADLADVAETMPFEQIPVFLAALPQDRARYLMGVGLPQDLLRFIAMGYALFDCVLPTRNGRNGTCFTAAGRLNMRLARHARDEQPIVRRAVRIVAGRAVLAHRRVLEEHRSAHLGVTGRAELGDRTAGLQVLDVADRPVRVVARRARHLAFAYGHVRHGPLGLGHLRAVARGTQLRLGRLHQLVFRRLGTVDAVAGRARDVPGRVLARLPPGV